MAIDWDGLFGVIDYDPCEALKVIRPAYYKLIAGEGEQKIQFRDRDVWFHKGDTTEMKALLLQLQQECAAQQGVTITGGKRFAITAGAIRNRS